MVLFTGNPKWNLCWYWFLVSYSRLSRKWNILINPFSHIDAFWRLSSIRLLKTWRTEEIAQNEHILLLSPCFQLYSLSVLSFKVSPHPPKKEVVYSRFVVCGKGLRDGTFCTIISLVSSGTYTRVRVKSVLTNCIILTGVVFTVVNIYSKSFILLVYSF